MPKPEWGTKRTCPQTARARFYDLGNDRPGDQPRMRPHNGTPEPVLKSKQPIPIDDPERQAKAGEARYRSER